MAPELPSAEVVEAARRLIAAHVPVTEDDLSAAEVYGAWVWTVPGPTLAQVIVAYADRLATAEVARDRIADLLQFIWNYFIAPDAEAVEELEGIIGHEYDQAYVALLHGVLAGVNTEPSAPKEEEA